MGKYGKWIGGGLGWALLGPLGGVLGFAVGSMFDRSDGKQRVFTGTTHGDFTMSLLTLTAAVMKADRRVMKSELDYVSKYFTQNFGPAASQEAMLYLRDLLKQEIPLRDVCYQIKHRLDHSSRLQLLHFLFGVSKADGKVHPREVEVIERIAGYLGISAKDLESIKAMFYEDTDAAYRILEINASAGDDDVKKAYRKMANKYHPDKVAYLGEDIRKAAGEKFRKVKNAYDTIKKDRGMN
ncbi:MAG: TerB family tellurite resistance protein [Bacteroidales bacterium]|nr:TerB family tellurite resistance protein [Bacteroidales bacterium]